MPRYAFRCRSCGLEFEVSRSMSDAGRDAACPADGKPADRIFTLPMTSVGRGDGPAVPAAGDAARGWSSPFFPKNPRSREAAGAPPPGRHVLPAGSSKPTRFRHFGHWHPAGTPPHTHVPRRPRGPKPMEPPES